MSIKVNTFAQVITNPLNKHNFVVDIPGLDIPSMVVSSTTFPSEQLQEVTLHYQGESIVYPTIPKQDHSWKITVPENDDGSIKKALDSLKSNVYYQNTGILIPRLWKNVKVHARDLAENIVFSVVLHGVWLKGRSAVDLSNSDATQNWEWNYEFVYQYITDENSDNTASKAPM